MNDVIKQKLAEQGVFKGFHGLEGFADAGEFWAKQPYGTRFYYGDGATDYIHRSVLEAAIRILKQAPPAEGAELSKSRAEVAKLKVELEMANNDYNRARKESEALNAMLAERAKEK